MTNIIERMTPAQAARATYRHCHNAGLTEPVETDTDDINDLSAVLGLPLVHPATDEGAVAVYWDGQGNTAVLVGTGPYAVQVELTE